MTLDLAGCTHVGLKRSENQDEVFAKNLTAGNKTISCLAVADGMGGHLKGREASQTAIGTLKSLLENWLKEESVEPNESWCVVLEEEAHNSVRKLSLGNEVAGTTLTVALIVGEECLIGHVGDSRAYCYRNGKLDQITEDQTWEAYSRKNQLDNQHGNALRQAIGVDERIVPDTYRVSLLPEDWLVVCSDGFYKMVDLADAESVLSESLGANDACQRLMYLALDGGGKDNIGICVARYGEARTPVKRRNWPLIIACAALVLVLILLLLALVGKL